MTTLLKLNISRLLNKMDRFTRWQIPETADPVDQLHYQIVNTLTFLILLISISEFLIELILGTWSPLSVNTMTFAAALPVLILIYKNKINRARNYFVVVFNLLLFIFSTHVDLIPFHFNNLFFASALLPFILYSKSERFIRLFGVLMSIFLLFTVTLQDYSIAWPFTIVKPFWNQQASHVLTLVLILLSVHTVLRFHDFTLKYLDDERARLINTDKLATLGELSSSLAHELKNPLAVIMSRTSLLQERSELGPVSKEDLDKTIAVIMRTGHRIEQTIKSIQALSRDSTRDELSPIPLKILLDDVIILLDHKFKAKEVELKIVDYDSGWQVMGRESQLVQVLMNLIGNAIDAVEKLQNRWVEVSFLQNQSHFLIQVKDSGAGIDSDLVKKIMSPFFTTKSSGKGTGLGLSISRRIMKDHEGDLVYVPDQGHTVFHMQFPLRHLIAPAKRVSAAS